MSFNIIKKINKYPTNIYIFIEKKSVKVQNREFDFPVVAHFPENTIRMCGVTRQPESGVRRPERLQRFERVSRTVLPEKRADTKHETLLKLKAESAASVLQLQLLQLIMISERSMHIRTSNDLPFYSSFQFCLP